MSRERQVTATLPVSRFLIRTSDDGGHESGYCLLCHRRGWLVNIEHLTTCPVGQALTARGTHKPDDWERHLPAGTKNKLAELCAAAIEVGCEKAGPAPSPDAADINNKYTMCRSLLARELLRGQSALKTVRTKHRKAGNDQIQNQAHSAAKAAD